MHGDLESLILFSPLLVFDESFDRLVIHPAHTRARIFPRPRVLPRVSIAQLRKLVLQPSRRPPFHLFTAVSSAPCPAGTKFFKSVISIQPSFLLWHCRNRPHSEERCVLALWALGAALSLLIWRDSPSCLHVPSTTVALFREHTIKGGSSCGRLRDWATRPEA